MNEGEIEANIGQNERQLHLFSSCWALTDHQRRGTTLFLSNFRLCQVCCSIVHPLRRENQRHSIDPLRRVFPNHSIFCFGPTPHYMCLAAHRECLYSPGSICTLHFRMSHALKHENGLHTILEGNPQQQIDKGKLEYPT